jgi:multiple sugar transport system substrate-binding protein
VLTDLTPYIADEAMADLFPEVRATREVEDGLYAVPMEVEPMAMFYSVQAFEEAGLSEGDIPETWDDLLAVAEQLTTPDRFGVLFEAVTRTLVGVAARICA